MVSLPISIEMHFQQTAAAAAAAVDGESFCNCINQTIQTFFP